MHCNAKGEGRAALVPAATLAVFILFVCFSAGAALADGEKANSGDKPYFTDVGQYNYARFLMREGDFQAAAREYARLIESFPGSPLIPRAQYGMSVAFYRAGRLRDAEDELKLFLSNFEDDSLAEEARLKLDEVRERLGSAPGEERPEPGIYNKPYGTEPESLRAVQVMLFEGKSYGEVDRELKRLKEAGIDTVIVRVFHNRGDRHYQFVRSRADSGVYFKTAHAPVVEDILSPVSMLAHANGLKVFAWMTTRYADYGVEDDADLACKAYDLERRELVKCKGLDLFNERSVKRLEAIYSDLAAYDIDGILFQDDLVLRHAEGFGQHMEALHVRDAGAAIDPETLYQRVGENNRVHYTGLFWEWASWKNARLLGVADRLRAAVHKKRPDVKFAINLMYESVTNPPYALAWLSQSMRAAMEEGFDYYSIMAYHRQMGEELGKDPEAVSALIGEMAAGAASTARDPRQVLMKLQTVDWRTGKPLSDVEVVALLKRIRGSADVSLAVVPYRGDFPFYELGSKELAALK